MISFPRLAQRSDRSRFTSSRARIAASIQRGLIVALAVGSGLTALAGSAMAQILQFGQTLSQRDEGVAVEQLQRELQERRLYSGPVTGFYGDLTRDAVLRLQQISGLTQDGVFGPLTEDALFGRPISSSPSRDDLAAVPPAPGIIEVLPPAATVPPIGSRPLLGVGDELNGPLAQLGVSAAGICSPSASADNDRPGLSTIQFGDTGSSVRALQERLAELRYNPGPIDGEFGSQTESAVTRFQQAQGLIATGVAGEETLQALGFGRSLIDTGNYVVVIPASISDVETLQTAQSEVTRACFARARQGSYIYAGGYNSRSAAENVSLRLRSLDLDSRVEYLRRLRFFN